MELPKLRAGFVGFGEVNTPRDRIERKCREAAQQLEAVGVELVGTAPVSDDPEGRDVRRAIAELSAGRFDALVVCIAGWIPSHAVISVLCEFKHLPILLWGLAGSYENGRLVTTADQAGTTALRSVLGDMGYAFKYVYNRPGIPPRMESIVGYLRAAAAVTRLKRSRIGSMGYRDMNLYGTQFEGISLRGTIGCEIEIFEMLEIVQRLETLDKSEIDAVVAKALKAWTFSKPAARATLETGARYYLAIRDKVRERGYEAVSLIDVDGMKKLAKFPPAMVFMLLADELGLCTVPENDSLGSVTQLIVKYLTGQIGAYLEFYEFLEDRVLMGVPDYVPAEIVDGPVRVIPTAFGSFSEGILNVSQVKTGPVTLCRLGYSRGKYFLHAAQGQAVAPRSWEEAGWQPPAPQLPSLEILLDGGVERFAENVLAQHYFIAYGDHRAVLKDFADLLGLGWIA